MRVARSGISRNSGDYQTDRGDVPGETVVTKIAQRVRYGETDGMGVAYYANYLAWFEVGRNHHFREHGIPYAEVERRGFYLPVSEVSCRILKPARYDDEIVILTSTMEVRSRKLTLAYRIEQNGNLLAEGETSHICLNQERKVAKIPEWMIAKLLP